MMSQSKACVDCKGEIEPKRLEVLTQSKRLSAKPLRCYNCQEAWDDAGTKESGSVELTQCGDSDTWGMIIWLGTKDKKEAENMTNLIVKNYLDHILNASGVKK